MDFVNLTQAIVGEKEPVAASGPRPELAVQGFISDTVLHGKGQPVRQTTMLIQDKPWKSLSQILVPIFIGMDGIELDWIM